MALAILDRERARLSPLAAVAPGMELLLTGGSSLPDLLTAGDVDLHLRVPAPEFDDLVLRLRAIYRVVLPGIWQDGFATFDIPGADPPVGIAVTAIDGEHDRRFRTGWARLQADPVARAAYNDLKQAHEGGVDADYRAAKSAFFDWLAGADGGTPGSARPTRATMRAMRSFKFYADARAPRSARDLGDLARRAESIGYTGLVIPDHLIHQLSPVPAMAVIAAATSRLRTSAFVLNNDLRHPVVLAQDLASLDVLSEGRIDVAIGAGWNEREYEAIGLPFDRGGVRVARLAEAVTVLKGCFGPDPFSFHGEHYTITDYDAGPKPVQVPYPPLFIGGGGRRILTLAAREADVVGFAPRILPGRRPDARSLTWAATEEKLEWVREAAGRRFDHIELNVYPSAWPVTVTEDLRGETRRVIDSLRERTGIELTEQEVIDSPHLFIGSIDRFVEKFCELRDRLGISSVMVGEMGELDPVVERLAA